MVASGSPWGACRMWVLVSGLRDNKSLCFCCIALFELIHLYYNGVVCLEYTCFPFKYIYPHEMSVTFSAFDVEQC